MARFLRCILPALLLLGTARSLGAPPTAKPPLEEAARVLAQLTRAPVRPFSTRDFGREPYTGARSVLVPEEQAEKLLLELRRKLPPGVVAFVGVTHSLAHPKPDGVELVVAPGKSQFDILRAAASDAVNYGMETEDLIKELGAWDREFGIDIWQAETDTIQLRFRSMPKDLHAFAQRVAQFCPDVVDQGVGSVQALETALRQARGVLLWWD